MLDIKGVEAFKAKLKAVMPTVEAEVNTKFRKLGRLIFTDLVNASPQWSGSLASSWYVGQGSFNKLGNEDWRLHGGETAYQRGMDPAVSSTLNRELSKLAKFTYRDTIVFHNAAPYASEVEAGQGPDGRPIREENKLAGYENAAMIGYVSAKYGSLGGKGLV